MLLLVRLLLAVWLVRRVTYAPPRVGAPVPAASTPPSRSRAYRYVWFLPLAVGAPLLLFVLLKPTGYLPGDNFYVVSAQIFPVLLVALAVEARMRAVWDNVPLGSKIPLIVALGVGELLSIVAASGVLSVDDPEDPLDDGLVAPTFLMSEIIAFATAMCLITSFVGVYVVALTKQPTGE